MHITHTGGWLFMVLDNRQGWVESDSIITREGKCKTELSKLLKEAEDINISLTAWVSKWVSEWVNDESAAKSSPFLHLK